MWLRQNLKNIECALKNSQDKIKQTLTKFINKSQKRVENLGLYV